MSANPIAPSVRYQEGVTAHRWQADPAQLALLPEFDRLHAALCAPVAAPGNGLFGRLKSLLGNDEAGAGAIPGLYLWGSVGRGKTFLMDLFAASLPHGVALRRHFHRFMGEVHEHLRALGERQNPLVEVATLLCMVPPCANWASAPIRWRTSPKAWPGAAACCAWTSSWSTTSATR